MKRLRYSRERDAYLNPNASTLTRGLNLRFRKGIRVTTSVFGRALGLMVPSSEGLQLPIVGVPASGSSIAPDYNFEL